MNVPSDLGAGAPDAEGERLQKVLARAGFGSRRVCENLIADGRVTVDGRTAVLGTRVRVGTQVVAVDGNPVGVAPGLVYYLLNKPVGVVTTARDTHGRATVVELVPDEPRVHPVGRLDRDTEGLLLLTNDGILTHRLTHRLLMITPFEAQISSPDTLPRSENASKDNRFWVKPENLADYGLPKPLADYLKQRQQALF